MENGGRQPVRPHLKLFSECKGAEEGQWGQQTPRKETVCEFRADNKRDRGREHRKIPGAFKYGQLRLNKLLKTVSNTIPDEPSGSMKTIHEYAIQKELMT